MNKMSLIVCVAVLVALVAARPNPDPGFGDQFKDMALDSGSFPNFGLDTGSMPDFGTIMCKGSGFAGGKGKAGFPGMDKIPGMDQFVASNCTSEESTTKGSDSPVTTEAGDVEATASS